MEHIVDLLSRLDRLERDYEDLNRLWKSSVDDIKAHIKAEIGDLKTEQIADLKQAIKDRDHIITEIEGRIRATEDAIRDWNTGRGIVNWMIRLLFSIIGAGAAVFGYEAFGRHH
jgi:chromosome segregation ATPase